MHLPPMQPISPCVWFAYALPYACGGKGAAPHMGAHARACARESECERMGRVVVA